MISDLSSDTQDDALALLLRGRDLLRTDPTRAVGHLQRAAALQVCPFSFVYQSGILLLLIF